MKATIKSLIIISFILYFNLNNLTAQNSSEGTIKSVLKNLIEYSKTKSYEKAASLIAYEGTDKNRIGKDSFNPTNKDEVNQAKRICKKISALVELSTKHDFGTFSVKKDGETEFYNLDVIFTSGEQKLVTTFSFIKNDSKFLLSNMN